MIDVPICFQKSSSLKTKNFELPLLKFSNFIMKKGKREQTLKNLFNAIRALYKEFNEEKLIINFNAHS
jgi:ribosomal protein S7